LARWYDDFTGDVPYGELAELYEKLLNREGKASLTLLDLCCGTGTLTWLFAQRGYEMIGTDLSPEMLSQAEQKTVDCAVRPMFLCQAAEELDLYGTVDGAFSCLDALNYIPPESLPEVFHRLHLFIKPGGVFAFDVQSPERLKGLDGGVFVDETEDALCLWRGEFDEEENALFYGMDIFTKEGGLWRRQEEEHTEYAHDVRGLCSLLSAQGFSEPEIVSAGALSGSGRVFISAVNMEH